MDPARAEVVLVGDLAAPALSAVSTRMAYSSRVSSSENDGSLCRSAAPRISTFPSARQAPGRYSRHMSESTSIIGRWRITEMDNWDQEAVDLVQPGFIEFDDDGLGELGFIVVTGELDCRDADRDGGR
jgi:hypothetical protein